MFLKRCIHILLFWFCDVIYASSDKASIYVYQTLEGFRKDSETGVILPVITFHDRWKQFFLDQDTGTARAIEYNGRQWILKSDNFSLMLFSNNCFYKYCDWRFCKIDCANQNQQAWEECSGTGKDNEIQHVYDYWSQEVRRAMLKEKEHIRK